MAGSTLDSVVASAQLRAISATTYPRDFLSFQPFDPRWVSHKVSPIPVGSGASEEAKSSGIEWRRECEKPYSWEREGAEIPSHMSQYPSAVNRRAEDVRNVESGTSRASSTPSPPSIQNTRTERNRTTGYDMGRTYDDRPEAGEIPKRSFGMQSILNPQQEVMEPGQRQPQPTQMEPLTRPSPRVRSPTHAPGPRSPPTYARHSPSSNIGGRKMITPRSPSLRASNFGIPRGINAAAESSAGTSTRVWASDPQHTTSSEAATSPRDIPPRQSFAFSHLSSKRPSSPNTTNITLPQLHPPSETYRFGGGTQQAQFAPSFPPSFGPIPGVSGQHHHSDNAPDVGPRTRQMYLDTAQGPIGIEVEVDTQAASRMADEKRRRNAGASARFRQRRKEKEREASHTISSLENEVKSMAEERDFYIAERNFFRELASRFTQIPPRASSPRQRRPLSEDEGGSGWSEPQMRTQGRRTSLTSAQLSTPIPAMPLGGQLQVLPLPPPPPPVAPGPPSSYQVPPFSPSRPSLAAPPLPPAAAGAALPQPIRSLPYDALRSQQEPYDRSWNPGR